MKKRILLGMLTPSSNTILEPITSKMIANLENVTAHFSRFGVTKISLSDDSLSQFDNSSLIQASLLLSDAKVNVITWNGTSAGWLGFDSDRSLCREITSKTSVPATTSTLALKDAFNFIEARNFALVTPYLDEIQDKIIANFEDEGFTCIAEKHLNDPGNFSFSEISEEEIISMVREVAKSSPDVITTYCTNLRGATIVDELEKEIGIPIFDTVSVAVWKSLILAEINPSYVKGWGQLFAQGKP